MSLPGFARRVHAGRLAPDPNPPRKGPRLALALAQTLTAAPATSYRAEFLQATPGRLLELIDLLKARQAAAASAGEARPFLLRHSQGDRWDLMVLQPLGESPAQWLASERASRRAQAGFGDAEIERRYRELVAWREELYVTGPELEEVAREFETTGFAHVEVFHAAPGSYDQLLEERRMEAAFSTTLGRPRLLIFERDPSAGGAPWDTFSIDLYRDLKHYAEASAIAPDAGDAAARKAGFTSMSAIGPTLRRFVASHHDTLAGVVR
jgi:hypothetical protein